MAKVSFDLIALRILVSPDLRLRFVRHSLLWSTTFFLIYQGFYYLSKSIAEHTPVNVNYYTIISTLIFGGLTCIAYWTVTTLTRRFLLYQYRFSLFLIVVFAVHIFTAEIVLLHFRLFTKLFTLNRLPHFYSYYAEHITQLPYWLAPFDVVIVWFFSFSLFYNYLLYAISLKIFKDFFSSRLRQVQLEKENLRLEFDFLKAQINPHFLFNTLNNIYSFVVLSPNKAATSILKLADLMRYTLYETSEEKVPLSKELAFLTSYIDLQRIRHDEHVTIQFTVAGCPDTQSIPPLLLIIFVENAFKHGIQASAKASWVDIQMSIQTDLLQFQVANSTPSVNNRDSAGIGLINVKKRLHHFYPQRHQLLIQPQSHQFTITLMIDLHE